MTVWFFVLIGIFAICAISDAVDERDNARRKKIPFEKRLLEYKWLCEITGQDYDEEYFAALNK